MRRARLVGRWNPSVPPHVPARNAAAMSAPPTETFLQNRLSVVFVGLMCCLFLSALDQARPRGSETGSVC